tara:strand:- start:593 stop:877 length:285 start_codon:yes stop_codon:yes gene_type:complete
MAPPPSKKQKTDPNMLIVFATTGGLKPDVRFDVLGKDYHVHSALLKLHSAFFAKFLDSADKNTIPTKAPMPSFNITGSRRWTMIPWKMPKAVGF